MDPTAFVPVAIPVADEIKKPFRGNPTSSLMMVAYLSLFGLWGASQLILVNVPINLIATSSIIIYIGAHRSLRLLHPDNKGESESITKDDAMKVPLFGSAVLLGLYLFFKFFNKDLVNLLLSIYFCLIGALTLAGTVDPMIHAVITSERRMGKKFKLPVIEEVDLTFTASELVSLVLGSVFGVIYFQTKHWAMNNILGISFCVQALERVSLGSYKVGAIMLCGLFFYDIFWVFGTDVMVTVAKSFDGPIKLVFPRRWADLLADPPIKAEFSMLGLGDIVVPGIFIALLLRYDAHVAKAVPELADCAKFPKIFFHSSMAAYIMGLVATMFVMYQFNAAQPALLYLVPACLITSLLVAACRKELTSLFAYTEEEEKKPEDTKKDA